MAETMQEILDRHLGDGAKPPPTSPDIVEDTAESPDETLTPMQKIISNFVGDQSGVTVELPEPTGTRGVPDVSERSSPDRLTISYKQYRRILLNKGTDPKIAEEMVQDAIARNQQPEINILPIMEVLEGAKKNFGGSLSKNFFNSIDPRQLPALLQFVGEFYSPENIAATAGFPVQDFRERRPSLSAMIDFYHETFDLTTPVGREVFKRYVEEDPSAFLSDVAVVLGPVGSMATKSGRVGALVEQLAANKYLNAAKVLGQTVIDPSKALDIGVKAVGKGLEGAFRTSPEVSPEILALQEKFKGEIPDGFPESVLSESPVVAFDEAARIQTSLVGRARRRYRAFDKGMVALVDKKISGLGGVRDVGELGSQVFSGFKASLTAFHNDSRRIFQELLGELGEVPGDFGNTIAEIDKILAENQGAVSGLNTDIPKLQRLRERLVAQQEGRLVGGEIVDEIPESATGVTMADIDEERTKFRQLFLEQKRQKAEAIVPETKRFQQRIYDAQTDDLFTAAERKSPELADQFRKAKADYRTQAKKFNSRFGDKIIELGGEGRFTELSKALLDNELIARETIPDILETIGPEATRSVRAAYLNQLSEKAKTAGGTFTATGLARQLKGRDREAMRLVLGDEGLHLVENVAATQLAASELKTILGGSRTAWNLSAIDKMILIGTAGAEAGDWIFDTLASGLSLPDGQAVAAGVAVMFGREAYASFIDSQFARKWKLEGHDFPKNMPEIVGKALQRTPRTATRIAAKVPTTITKQEERDIERNLQR